MQFVDIMGYISVVITLLVYAIYIPSILRGKTKPHIFSWLIWAVLTVIVFFVQLISGGGPGTWTTGTTAIACFVIFAMCFKYGTPDITKSDRVALVFGILSVIAWYMTDDPFLTLCFILLAETLGFYPTFRKSYHAPDSEPLSSFYLSVLKFAFALAATETYNFYTLSYPVYFMLIYLSFVVMVLCRKRVLLNA